MNTRQALKKLIEQKSEENWHLINSLSTALDESMAGLLPAEVYRKTASVQNKSLQRTIRETEQLYKLSDNAVLMNMKPEWFVFHLVSMAKDGPPKEQRIFLNIAMEFVATIEGT